MIMSACAHRCALCYHDVDPANLGMIQSDIVGKYLVWQDAVAKYDSARHSRRGGFHCFFCASLPHALTLSVAGNAANDREHARGEQGAACGDQPPCATSSLWLDLCAGLARPLRRVWLMRGIG